MKKRKRNSLGQFAKNSKSEISLVNLSSYTTPIMKEQPNKDWVKFGEDNNYFQYILDRYNGSATNHAAVNGIAQQIFGKGLNALNANKKPDQYAKMVSLFKKDCVRKIAYDFYLFGQAAIQVVYSKDRKTIAKAEHFPVETLRSEKANDKGDIEAYYYFKDWSKIKPNEEPKRIAAFGTSKEAIEILYIKPYKAGLYYYSTPSWNGCIQYCELEEEISNYHINNIQQGLSPTMLISMHNGVPNPEERRLLESKIAQKFSGSSNAGKFILSFSDSKEQEPSLTPVQLSDAHQQYEFLSNECSRKIMIGHRIVSPFLLGIRENGGFGSNADEIKTASLLFDNTVIRPLQEVLIDCFDKILAYNDISLKLYFVTLQPLEFTEIDTDLQDDEDIEEETGIQMSNEKPELDDKLGGEIADELINLGQTEEELLKDYDLVDSRPVDYEQDHELDGVIQELNKEKKSTLSKIYEFVSTGIARKTKDSAQDGTSKQSVEKLSKFLVRYVYNPTKTGSNSREFCKKMVRAKKVYRKEDILEMTRKRVNPKFAKSGSKTGTYSVWLYKGGARCQHRWYRQTYLKKWDNAGMGKQITSGQAKSLGFKFPRNAQKVPVAPKDMRYKGYTKAYYDKMFGKKKKK
tara:strand:+ start:1840 stop:3732 length:1893 start_codon:yes stop_codon:yes gene_type:complete